MSEQNLRAEIEKLMEDLLETDTRCRKTMDEIDKEKMSKDYPRFHRWDEEAKNYGMFIVNKDIYSKLQKILSETELNSD